MSLSPLRMKGSFSHTVFNFKLLWYFSQRLAAFCTIPMAIFTSLLRMLLSPLLRAM